MALASPVKWLLVVALCVTATTTWYAYSVKRAPDADPDGSAGTADVSVNTSVPWESWENRPEHLGQQPPADLGLKLRDIFPANGNHESLAIIQLRDTDAELFTEGSDVFGLGKVESINEDHVILHTATGKLTLALDTAGAAGNIEPDSPTGPDGLTNNSSIRELARQAAAKLHDPDNKRARKPGKLYTRGTVTPPPYEMREIISRAREESLKTQSASAWGYISFEPSMEMEQVSGLRLVGHDEAEFLNRHGLDYGDIITSVNGKQLDTPAAANEGIAMIAESNTLELVVDRGGQSETLIINK